MEMTGEFTALPEEFGSPAEEWTPPIKERIFSADRVQPEQDGEETIPASEKNRSGGLRQKLKAYAVSAVAVVAAVSMAGNLVSPPQEWDYAQIDRDLSDYHFAYYARSPEEMETYLENEMWYRYFGKLGDHEADYYGLYGQNADGPDQDFRDAVEVFRELLPDSGIPGLPSYSYRLLLKDAAIDGEELWHSGEVILLESPYQVVISYRENGDERFGFVEVPPSGTPIGEQQFRCSFDISFREDGTPDADLRVFGNGVDIVGFFEKHLEDGEPYVIAHATNEHSNNACGNDLAYIIRIRHGG